MIPVGPGHLQGLLYLHAKRAVISGFIARHFGHLRHVISVYTLEGSPRVSNTQIRYPLDK